MSANGNGEVATMNGSGGKSSTPKAAGRLPKITTSDKHDGICHDMAAPTVKAQTIDELHSLQKKKSAPSTPINGFQCVFSPITEEERQKQQLQSISASLASLTRETGPKVVRGDPADKTTAAQKAHHISAPTISVSDSALKFTHVLYNLSPAGYFIT